MNTSLTQTIYLIRNAVNGKVYVGKTEKTIVQRLYEHKGNARRGGEFRLSQVVECCIEYTLRYRKMHAAERIIKFLAELPKNIPHGVMVDPPLSMPDEYKVDDAVTAYQNLYVGEKARFARWTNRRPPEWFIQRTPDYDPSNFERTRNVVD
ncbi:GIY-YIG nuclease family protein [Acinetobacter sp.]|uniref:GIY-YIG nuclease family protein n=1 Tax=Acinetobacter sp. TaxID=472 RepID=UPI00388EF886